jgi:hypothetical protein
MSLLGFLLFSGMSLLFIASDNILDEGDENWYNNQVNNKNK